MEQFDNTTTMTLNQILDCIRKWDSYRSKPDELSDFFGTKNHFECGYNDSWSCNMHVYPGIDTEDKIWYFAIPKIYDTASYSGDLAGVIQQCLLLAALPGEEITPTEAHRRINSWLDDHSTWLPAQAQTQYGIFQAFDIPKADMTTSHFIAYQALATAVNPTGYRADLVIDDGNANTGAFYDTVRPVPPFKSTADQASFYLLTLAGV